LRDLSEGRHPFFSEKLAKAELPKVLTSIHALERSDGDAIQYQIN
jgi:hypothetical protein